MSCAWKCDNFIVFLVVHKAYDAFFAAIFCQVFWLKLSFAQLFQQGGSRRFPVAVVSFSINTDENGNKENQEASSTAALAHGTIAEDHHHEHAVSELRS